MIRAITTILVTSLCAERNGVFLKNNYLVCNFLDFIFQILTEAAIVMANFTESSNVNEGLNFPKDITTKKLSTSSSKILVSQRSRASIY